MNQKIDLNQIVEDCHKIAAEYLKNWQPLNRSWKTIDGCAYLRLSTEEQVAVDRGSLEQQIHMAVLEAETRSKQHQVNYKIIKFYIEPGVSGRNADRVELKKLMRAVNQRLHKFVILKEISRLTRDSAFWKDFFKKCQEKGCEIVIRGLPVDPNDPASILQLDILAAFAEYESRNTSKRISDSVFSAMKTSGKFNSTHRRLGLKPKVQNGIKMHGFYDVDEREAEDARTVFKTFLKYANHNKTIEVLQEKGIKNWDGEFFKRHALITLLSDTRLISKWYLNRENRNKDQDPLPEKERYYEIDLKHESIIPMELWNQVQLTLKDVAGNLGKMTRIERIFTLSGGLLKFHDGSVFRGVSGTGKTKKSFYYFNQKNKLRIRCDLVEDDVKRMVTKLLSNSPELQKSIKLAGGEVSDSFQTFEKRLHSFELDRQRLIEEKKNYLKKMDMLIAPDSSPDDIQKMRSAFKDFLNQNEDRHNQIENQISQTKKALESLKRTNFSWSEVTNHAHRVQEVMAEKDPAALKRAYHSLFDSIVIGPEDESGCRQITYVLKNWDGSLEDISRLKTEMVEAFMRLSNPRVRTI